MNEVLEALRAYHFALDMRQHAGPAAQTFIMQVEKILGETYVQGRELTRRQVAREKEGKK